jgi:hypothetical protein
MDESQQKESPMGVIDPTRTWERLEKRLADADRRRGLLQSGVVSMTKLSRDDLPQAHVELVYPPS